MGIVRKGLITVLLLISAFATNAQIDTLFWFAAPEVSASAGDTPIYLRFMTYNDAADITVTTPAAGGTLPVQTLTIPAGSVDSINLTAFLASVESPAANAASDNGIRVESTYPISVFYELKSGSNKEIFTLKGSKAFGDNFYTPFQKFWDNAVTTPASFSSIDIVATEDNTTILITPRTDVVGHVQNTTYSVTLNQGQTYSARDMNTTAASTLAGSIVSSNKPIAITVFSGALSESGCVSTMGDQITSETYTGKKYIVHKGTSGTDRVYIMATQNGTNVTIDNSGTTSAVLNWGETYELPLADMINHISSNKPIYVWHATGYGCELSGAQVPPVYCAGTYETAFTRTSNDSLGVIVYTRSGFEGDFMLNGNPSLIPAGAFSNVPGTSGAYKVAMIYFNTTDVPLNSYNLVTNSGDIFGLGVIQGNNGNGANYAYYSEYNSYPFVTAGLDDTICANTNLSLTGLVGGGSVTGVWSGTGYGSFALSTDQLINTYVPSPLDTLVSPIELILTSTGPCPALKDTLILEVEPAPIVNASADQTLCENNSTVALAGTVSGGATTGGWTTLGSGTFSPDTSSLNANYVPSAADLSAGSVMLVLTSTNVGSCLPESDTMVVTFTPAATVDAGNDTIYVCENNPTVTLNGAVSGATTTGKWTSSGTGIFSPDNLSLSATYQPSVADINAGSIWIYLESTNNGSCVPVYDSLIVMFTPSPAVNAGTNFITCTNNTDIQLNGTVTGGSTTGVWSGGSGTYTPGNTDLNATYTPTAAEVSGGTLFLTLTSTNNGGCNSVNDAVQIDFVAPPFANFNFTEVCLNNPSVFTDFSLPGYGNLNSWQWDFGDAATSTNQDDSHIYGAPGTYDVQLIVTSDIGCSDTSLQQVQVFENPVADFSYTADCSNNQATVNFTDQSTTVSDAINFWLYDFGGQGTAAIADPTQTFTSNGNYTIMHIVETVNGCSDTAFQVLNVPPNPVADFSYNSNNGLNIGAVFNFVNTSTNATTYWWDFGNNNNSTDVDPSNTYFANGDYFVTLYAYGALGCVDSTTQLITINTVTTEISTLIPNAISPNGDQKNDVWKLEFLSLLYPNARVEIYNEWGQQLFSSVGYDIPWDGTYQGQNVPEGTYFYVIDLDNDDPEAEIYKGTILVLKSRN